MRRSHAYDVLLPPRGFETFENRAHRFAGQALASAIRTQDPASFGRTIEILAQPAPAAEDAAIADRIGLAPPTQDEGPIAVEQPASGIAAEALEMIREPAMGGEVAMVVSQA